MRPKRNRGQSHKKNVLRKYIIKFITYDHNFAEPVICKKGSHDPRVGGSWPTISKQEKYELKKIFKVAKPRYFNSLIKNEDELKEFINMHNKNRYTILDTDMYQDYYYANINPYTLLIDGLINFDKKLYYHDKNYNHYWSWDQNDYNYIRNEYNYHISKNNTLKTKPGNAAKLRRRIYKYGNNYKESNWLFGMNEVINGEYLTYLPLKDSLKMYNFENEELYNFLNNYFH